MSLPVNINGVIIPYPQTGDTGWGDDATKFAVEVASVLGKIGQSQAPVNDDIIVSPGNLSVTSGNLSVGGDASVTGNTTITGNVTVNGNSNLGNGTSDTTAITGILNVDSGVLYVDPTNNRVGINDATPSVELDVNGAVAITGNETVGGTLNVTGATTLSNTLGVTGDVAVNTNKFNVTASSGNTTIAGTLGISNGTASNPSLTPSGDANTGIYSIGSDKIGFSANGSRVGEFGSGYGGFTGNVIQVAYAELTTSTVTSSVSIPVDNTIPQNTEGVEILNCSITPKYANSILYIESNSYIGESANNVDSIIQALFRDSTADAISVSFNNANPPGSSPFGASLSFNPTYMLAKEPANSTSATTFKLRAGGGGFPTTLRVNGTSSQYFNGKLITYIRIIEVQV